MSEWEIVFAIVCSTKLQGFGQDQVSGGCPTALVFVADFDGAVFKEFSGEPIVHGSGDKGSDFVLEEF